MATWSRALPFPFVFLLKFGARLPQQLTRIRQRDTDTKKLVDENRAENNEVKHFFQFFAVTKIYLKYFFEPLAFCMKSAFLKK